MTSRHLTVLAKTLYFQAVCPPCSSGQILLPQYLVMNGLINCDETCRGYLLAPTDDLIRFWRSELKRKGHSRPSRSILV